MKMINKYIRLFVSALAISLTSCDKEGLLTYSGADVVNFNFSKMQLSKDSVDIAYGFVVDEYKQLDLQLLLTGYAQPVDRPLNIQITSEEGAQAGVHYEIPEHLVLPANEVMVTIPFKVLRPEVLKDQSTSFLIQIEDSKDLQAGMNRQLFVSVSDNIPDEWIGDKGWFMGKISDYFGECSKTKYLFVYKHLGVWDFSAYSIWGMMADKNKFEPAKRIVKEKLAEYEATNGPLVDKVAGSNCLLGQIATFMETLHLSYTEVLHGIPYRNLMLMQKDKMHEALGDVENVEYKSARENPKFKKMIK